MNKEEFEKLKQTIVYFGHWYDVIGEERVLILEKSIKYIEALDKENGKLEGKLADLQSEYVELENFKNNEVNELKVQLNKAKKIIQTLIESLEVSEGEVIRESKVIKEIEQFLEEATDV